MVTQRPNLSPVSSFKPTETARKTFLKEQFPHTNFEVIIVLDEQITNFDKIGL